MKRLLILICTYLIAANASAVITDCAEIGEINGKYNLSTTLLSPDGNTFVPFTNSDGVPTVIQLVPFKRHINGSQQVVPGAYRVNTNFDQPLAFPAIGMMTENNWTCQWTAFSGLGLMIPNFPNNPGQMIKGPELETFIFLERTASGFTVGGQLHRVRFEKISP